MVSCFSAKDCACSVVRTTSRMAMCTLDVVPADVDSERTRSSCVRSSFVLAIPEMIPDPARRICCIRLHLRLTCKSVLPLVRPFGDAPELPSPHALPVRIADCTYGD